MTMLRLYTYFRSSAAYRVRIALALKGLAYESVPVHLLRGGGEQLQGAYRAVNPAALVPALQDDDATLTQSLALLEYLEETHPQPALLPQGARSDPAQRADGRLVGVVTRRGALAPAAGHDSNYIAITGALAGHRCRWTGLRGWLRHLRATGAGRRRLQYRPH